MKKTLLRTTVSLLATAALTLPAAANTLLVNWGGNYFVGESATDLNILTNYGTQEPISGGFLLPYSTVSTMSPDKHARYDADGTSATFYGAVQITSQSGTTTDAQVRILRNNDQNRIHINTAVGNASNHTFTRGLFFWKKEDFLNGFADQPNLSLADFQKLTLNTANARSNQNTAIRFAVLSDGVWYLSQTQQTGTYFNSAPGEFLLAVPVEENWGIWNPATSPLDLPPTTFDKPGSELDNITAIGFYFDGTYTGSNSASFDFQSFSVTVIPEPGAAALLGLPVLLLAASRFKRRRQALPPLPSPSPSQQAGAFPGVH
ncbi:MAG TPA: hypothetical protein VNQ90_20810 [Chthoniobacteraceae bacterium]|nr:hypothetical protein [Chthoniobacteraceae bacterium]